MSLNRRQFLQRSATALAGLWAAGCGGSSSSLLPGGSASSPTSLPWEVLARSLQGPLLRPGAVGFDKLVAPWNLRYLGRQPAGLARCQTAADVQACLAWAQTYGVPLVARSGGHSYAGFSLTDGLMIDVSPMNSVQLDGVTGRVRLGGGARNLNLYESLRPPSVAVTHGRCKGVGVAGLVLGGGIGFNMRLHGLTCDQLVETEVVTADGRLLTCNASQNSDLFWACRGAGGGNFGIHTSFTFQTFPVTQMTYFLLQWNSSQQQVLSALAQLLPGTPRELGCKVSLVADATGLFQVQLLGQLLGPPSQLDSLLAPVLAVAAPDSRDVRQLPYWDAQDLLSEEGAPEYSHERSHYVVGPLSEAALGTVVDFMRRWPGTSVSADWKFFLQGGAVADLAPGDTAFVHRQASMISSIELTWGPQDSPKTIEINQAWLDDFHAAMQSLTSSSSYQNFIDADQADYLRAYYGANLERLVAVKAALDPNNLFNYPQGIPTRLSA